MGPSFKHPNSIVLGGPGDHTAGIIYSNWTHPKSPITRVSRFTNYPYGEVIWQPMSLTSQIMTTGHWILAWLTNIVFAWNLLVFVGYMSNALLMFAFIKWLTRNNLASFLAAYAVAFTPFHYFASLGQIAGLYSSIFILIIWQFLALFRSPVRSRAIGLGATLGISFYLDGYYILFALVVLGGFWLASLTYLFLKNRQLLNQIKQKRLLSSLTLASAVAGLLLSPLLWINHHYSGEINSVLTTARGSVASDAQTYSAQLSMYVNPKSLVYIGFTITVLAGLAVWFLITDYRKQTAKQLSLNFFSGWSLAIVGLAALWTSLKPVSHILGLSLYGPSKLIIAITPTWRVFGRLYAIVAICFISLAALTLTRLMQNYTKYRYLIFGVCMIAIAAELSIYLVVNPRYSFDYSKPPAVYSWLNHNPQIRAVAEYPLDELPQGAYLSDYYTFQEISGKPILNSLLPNSPNASLRRSIAGINDPQTLSVLRALGIDMVNVRPLSHNNPNPIDVRVGARRNSQLDRKFSFTGTSHYLDSFVLRPGPSASYALTIPGIQYFQLNLTADGHAKYLVDDDVKLAVVELPNATKQKTVTISFDIAADSTRQAAIIQNGTTIGNLSLTTSPQKITLEVKPEFPLTIYTQRTNQLTHITLANLQVVQ